MADFIIGRKRAGGLRQSQRASLGRQQADALKPYESVKSTIELLLIRLDKLKLDFEKFIIENK
jgi:hypothetical protein